METPALAAAWFLVPALPVCLWVAWSDLSRMKIPNKAVLALAVGFAVVGPFVLPLAEYGWRWVHLAVMLAVGIVANAVRLMGAGDAKFIAAAAPYVALGDLGAVALILAAASVLAFAGHRLARISPLRARVPDWHSWEAGNRFPFGLPLATALIAYLALAALGA